MKTIHKTFTLKSCIRKYKENLQIYIHILEILFVFLFHWIDTISVVQSLYSSELTATSQIYSRNCIRVGFYYETIQVHVMMNGKYIIGSISNIYTFGYIYNGSFNPFNPDENVLSKNYKGCSSNQFKLIVDLQANTTYILVVTTNHPYVTGAFSIFVSGPKTVSLNRFSKYLSFSLRNALNITKSSEIFLITIHFKHE